MRDFLVTRNYQVQGLRFAITHERERLGSIVYQSGAASYMPPRRAKQAEMPADLKELTGAIIAAFGRATARFGATEVDRVLYEMKQEWRDGVPANAGGQIVNWAKTLVQLPHEIRAWRLVDEHHTCTCPTDECVIDHSRHHLLDINLDQPHIEMLLGSRMMHFTCKCLKCGKQITRGVSFCSYHTTGYRLIELAREQAREWKALRGFDRALPAILAAYETSEAALRGEAAPQAV